MGERIHDLRRSLQNGLKVLLQVIALLSIVLNTGFLLSLPFGPLPRLYGQFDRLLEQALAPGSLRELLGVLNAPGLVITTLVYAYFVFFWHSDDDYYGVNERRSYLVLTSIPAILRDLFLIVAYTTLAARVFYALYPPEASAAPHGWRLDFVMDSTMLGVTFLVAVSNFASLLEEPLDTLAELVAIFGWVVLGDLLGGAAPARVFSDLHVLAFQVMTVYILSIPLKAMFYSERIFALELEDTPRDFPKKLLLAILTHSAIPALLGVLFCLLFALLIVVLLIPVLAVYAVLETSHVPEPYTNTLPFPFLFSPLLLSTAYLWDLARHAPLQLLTLLAALLSNLYFYDWRMKRRIEVSPAQAPTRGGAARRGPLRLVERLLAYLSADAVSEFLGLDTLAAFVHLPRALATPRWFWGLAAASISANLLLLLLAS